MLLIITGIIPLIVTPVPCLEEKKLKSPNEASTNYGRKYIMLTHTYIAGTLANIKFGEMAFQMVLANFKFGILFVMRVHTLTIIDGFKLRYFLKLQQIAKFKPSPKFPTTVEPPNKGHVGDNINSAVLSFIERLSFFRCSKCTKTIGHVIFGTSNRVLYREVYYTVSLFRRVHYRRFHCIR